ncbi:MAG: YsnF/AvaK domain-containing protein [Chloroflexota bacterium]|nr:YsnF/AvaK domain-containing protein [Chloroflexota bacterium]
MTRGTLSELDWELVYPDQDLRGHRLLDATGAPLGTIREMIVDTDAERVDAVVLDNGVEYPTSAIEIRGDAAVLRGGVAAADLGAAEVSGAAETVPLRAERLVVQKRPVERGAVEIKKDVIAEEQTVDVPVAREEVVVERHPVEPRPADRPIGEGETIRVPVRGEEVTVEKQPMVTEELTVGTREVAETRQVSDTVRREVVDVDKEGEVDPERRR